MLAKILIKLSFLTILFESVGATLITKNDDSLYSNQDQQCRTWIISSNEKFLLQSEIPFFNANSAHENYITLVHHTKYFDSVNPLSYFAMEHSPTDLLFPTKFILKLTRPCSFVIVTASTIEDMSWLTSELFFKRLSRPHKDYFFYTGDQASNFLLGEFAQNLRFKYAMISPRQFESPCGFELFSRKCPGILNGRKILVSAVNGPQMCRFQNREDGSLISGGGIYFEMLQESAHHLNFTFNIRLSSNGGASGFKRNGTWKGAVGDVFNGETDMAITAAISSPRLSIVDPSVPQGWINRIFFVRKPPLKTKWMAIFRPFDAIVWTLVGLSILALATTMYLSAKTIHMKTSLPWTCVIMSLCRMFLDQTVWLTQKPGVNSRIRFLLFLWSIFSIVMGTGYRSKLMSFLAFIQSPAVPTTHQELVNSDFTLYFRYYGGVAYEFMLKSNRSVHRSILERAILVNSSYECIILAGLTENSACLDYDFHGNYAMLTNATLNVEGQELFVQSKEKDIPLLMAWCFRKGSPLTETLDQLILTYIASGLYEYWLNTDFKNSKIAGAHWLQSQKSSPLKAEIERVFRNLSTGPKALTVNSLLGLMLITIVGLASGVIEFLIEINTTRFRKCFVHWLRRSRRKVGNSVSPHFMPIPSDFPDVQI